MLIKVIYGVYFLAHLWNYKINPVKKHGNFKAYVSLFLIVYQTSICIYGLSISKSFFEIKDHFKELAT